MGKRVTGKRLSASRSILFYTFLLVSVRGGYRELLRIDDGPVKASLGIFTSSRRIDLEMECCAVPPNSKLSIIIFDDASE